MEAGIVSGRGLLHLSFLEEVTDLSFSLAYELIEDFRTVNNFWLGAVERLCNLPGNKGLSCTGRPMQHQPFTVLEPIHLDNLRRISPTVESTAENLTKLRIQPTNAQLLKVEVFLKDLFTFGGLRATRDLQHFRRVLVVFVWFTVKHGFFFDRSVIQLRVGLHMQDRPYSQLYDELSAKKTHQDLLPTIDKLVAELDQNRLANLIIRQLNHALLICRQIWMIIHQVDGAVDV